MSFLALPIESDDSYTAPCSLQPVPQPSTSYCQLHQHPSATKVPLPAPAHNNLFLPKRSLYASRNGIKSAGPSNNASQDIPDIMAFTPQERLHALQTEREQLRPEQNLRAAQIDRSIEAIHLQMRTPVPHPAFSRSLPAPV